jgi:hypothetical protein
MILLRAARYAGQAPLHHVRLEDLSSVAPQERRRIWGDAWPLLERAATRTDGGTEEEVAWTLLRGDAQLWSVFDSEAASPRLRSPREGLPSDLPAEALAEAGAPSSCALRATEDRQERRRAAVTTQITLIGEKGCRLWLVGGSRMAEWAADFLAEVEPWARSLGCTHVWGTQSRAGWQRIVRLFGGEPVIVDGKTSWMRRF